MFGFPFVQQHDSMQCGVACLQMIIKYYGLNCDYQYLDNICFATSEGVSLNGISCAAKEIGLKSLCGTLTIKQLSKNIFPCIIHWNQNHFVVLYKVDKNGHRFWIADPQKGKYTLSIDEFKKHWVSITSDTEDKGIAMYFEPTERFLNFSTEAEFKKRSFRFLFGYLLTYKKYFLQILLGLLCGCLLQFIMPF